MTDNPPPGAASPQTPPQGNPETLARFRRETWWQVTFPVLLVALLAIAALVLLIVLGGPAAVSVVADYSLALLVILALLPILIVFALAAGLVYLVSLLIRKVPPYTHKAQQFVQRASDWVDQQTDRLAGTVITIRSALAGLGAVGQRQEEPRDGAGQVQPDSQVK